MPLLREHGRAGQAGEVPEGRVPGRADLCLPAHLLNAGERALPLRDDQAPPPPRRRSCAQLRLPLRQEDPRAVPQEARRRGGAVAIPVRRHTRRGAQPARHRQRVRERLAGLDKRRHGVPGGRHLRQAGRRAVRGRHAQADKGEGPRGARRRLQGAGGGRAEGRPHIRRPWRLPGGDPRVRRQDKVRPARERASPALLHTPAGRVLPQGARDQREPALRAPHLHRGEGARQGICRGRGRGGEGVRLRDSLARPPVSHLRSPLLSRLLGEHVGDP
ncbi:MAG: hypothetical protein A4E50_02310 [Methanosaeta sp. PtaB.Bin087]|nr:MAG: hypothetical protein A4E50_02310 [Methanosaeta sp. PtaB.Bin087]